MRWSDVRTPTTQRVLWEFASLLALVGLLSMVLLEGTGRCLGVLGLMGGLIGLIRPRWLAPLFLGWRLAVFPLAWLVTLLVLAVIFFGLITPLGLWLRLRCRDLLQRRIEPEQDSYWEERPASTDPTRYLQPF